MRNENKKMRKSRIRSEKLWTSRTGKINYLNKVKSIYFIINKATILAMVIPTLLAYALSLFISLQKVTKIKPIDVMNRE